MRILGIDPGLSGTGWAVLDDGGNLVLSGVLNFTSGKEEWQKRAIKYGKVVGEICKVAMVDLVGIEYPAFFNSAGGTMVAKKGDLLKLTFLVGIIYSYVRRHQGIKVLLVPVNEWKGQLPKEIVVMRIIRKLGKKQTKKLKSHDWDATGIALHLSGVKI